MCPTQSISIFFQRGHSSACHGNPADCLNVVGFVSLQVKHAAAGAGVHSSEWVGSPGHIKGLYQQVVRCFYLPGAVLCMRMCRETVPTKVGGTISCQAIQMLSFLTSST